MSEELTELDYECCDEQGDLVERTVGKWLSAALEDPNVCDEMKRDINEFFAVTSAARGQWDMRDIVISKLEMLRDNFGPVSNDEDARHILSEAISALQEQSR